jgi:hypothetical protein
MDKETWRALFRADKGVLRTWATDPVPLDPRKAVTITMLRLYELADHAEEMEGTEDADMPIRVPRIPSDVTEALRMLPLINYADGCMYAGYTADELAVLPGGACFSITTDAFRRSLD